MKDQAVNQGKTTAAADLEALLPVVRRCITLGPSLGGGGTLCVSARDLYRYLGNKQGFEKWFAKKVKLTGVFEGEDYCSAPPEDGLPSRLMTADAALAFTKTIPTERASKAREYLRNPVYRIEAYPGAGGGREVPAGVEAAAADDAREAGAAEAADPGAAANDSLAALVPIAGPAIGGEGIPTVNARDLHRYLDIGQDFSNWIKVQIERANLVERVDYLVIKKGEQVRSGLKWLIEYYLTLRAAKHICMMSNTERGRVVRDYFIQAEQRYRTGHPAQIDVSSPEGVRKMLAAAINALDESQRLLEGANEKSAMAREELAELRPQAALGRLVADMRATSSITRTAKKLGVRPGGLIKVLVRAGWVYRHPRGNVLVASQARIDSGHMDQKYVPVDGKVYEQAVVTVKGEAGLSEMVRLAKASGEIQEL